jgi:hypothetical protein
LVIRFPGYLDLLEAPLDDDKETISSGFCYAIIRYDIITAPEQYSVNM